MHNLPACDVTIEKKKLTNLVENIISQAKNMGASACEVDTNIHTGFEATVRLGEIETVEFMQDRGVGITVYINQRRGTASTTDLSDEVIHKTIMAACNIAKHTQEDNCAGLADAKNMAATFPALDLYHPWNIKMEDAIDLAKQCEQSALDVSDLIVNAEGTSVSTSSGCEVYGNSHGFIGTREASRHSISCIMIARKNEEMQRDYWYSVARKSPELEQVEKIGHKAANRTLSRLGGKKVKTGVFPVLFASEVASSLIGHFISAASGGNLYRDASFLKNSLGKTIFPQWLRIYETPCLVNGMGSSSYDGDGLQTRQQDFVLDGKLCNYILSTYSSRKLGMQSTANAGGVRNLQISINAKSEELFKKMGTGLLVTEFIGGSVSTVTGDYSRGASGFWIENGEIIHPVDEVTIAGKLQDIFTDILYVGDDLDKRKNIITGSILVEKMTIAGN